MGAVFSSIHDYFAREYFVAVLGLDSAGKTALVHRITYGTVVDTVPTCGFQITSAKIHHSYVQLADMCGQDLIRQLWGVMYHNADGVIYVIDGTDALRLSTSLLELNKVMLYPSLENKPFLILVNKQDEDNAIQCASIKHDIRGNLWRAFDVSIKTGDGVDDALTWFAANLE